MQCRKENYREICQHYVKMESMASLKEKNKEKSLPKTTRMFIFLTWQKLPYYYIKGEEK